MKLIQKIFNTIDFDHNGLITISEFITAAIDRKKFLTSKRLKKAFDMFDKDCSGTIEVFEFIKMCYRSGMQVEAW